jgi:hypothetical protein
MICKECNAKIQERGVLSNDEMCKDCREIIEKLVASGVEKMLCEV